MALMNIRRKRYLMRIPCRKKTGKLEGLKVAIIGDIMHSRVALSNIYLLTKMGAEITVAGPPTLIPKYLSEAFNVNVTYI
jgi:aspartate carbamoyltransferase catalytic subunit